MKKIICAILFIYYSSYSLCQIVDDFDTLGKFHSKITLSAYSFSDQQLPFWFRTNQYGSVPLNGTSGSAIASIQKNYKVADKKNLLDWGLGIEGRVNIGNKSQFILTEGYIKGRLSIFQLKAGRSKEIIGLIDTCLSAGAFSVSGNALGIPKVQLAIPEYWSLPLTNQLLAIKGTFAHGWLGEEKLLSNPYTGVDSINSYYHELSVYGRFGKPSWKFKLYGGFNHFAMWGNEQKMYGKSKFDLNNLQTLYYIVTGQPYHKGPTGTSKVGNHLGSIDQALEYDFGKTGIYFYHQFFYDVGGLIHGNNIKDGLFGISYTNKNWKIKKWGWKKILVEYWGSKSQGGEPDAPITPSGDEDYYNNYLYYHAWSYKNENIGNNFLTNRLHARKDLPNRETEYVVNSRVILWHAALQVFAYGWDVTGKFSFSKNYGTYGSSPWGNSTGTIRTPGPPPYFSQVSQFSGLISAEKSFKNGYAFNLALAADRGKLLYNSIGGMIGISKTW